MFCILYYVRCTFYIRSEAYLHQKYNFRLLSRLLCDSQVYRDLRRRIIHFVLGLGDVIVGEDPHKVLFRHRLPPFDLLLRGVPHPQTLDSHGCALRRSSGTRVSPPCACAKTQPRPNLFTLDSSSIGNLVEVPVFPFVSR